MTLLHRPNIVGQTSGLPVAGTSGSISRSANSPSRLPNVLISGLHSRGALPHLKREGATYFVTFRLSGTLPREVLLTLRREREAIVEKARSQNRPLTWGEQKELFHWYSDRVDQHLDEGHGQCWLREPELAGLVAGTLRFFEGQRYNLQAWVVMPNHVHVVLQPAPEHSLSSILKSWKVYSALRANRTLQREGRSFWQTEFYDHCCRDDHDLARCCAYTTFNPVKAGLCARPQDWPWSSLHVGQTSGVPIPGTSGSATPTSLPHQTMAAEQPPTVRPEV